MRRLFISAAVLAASITVIYLPVRSYDFVKFDDPQYVQANDMVRQGLTAQSVRWALAATDPAYWHPLTMLSHMLDVQLFGLDPGAHHLVNVALHAVNTVLLLLLLWRMTGAFWRSLFVAALFAFHPLGVESVAWISSRKNLLSTAFWLGAMLAYVAHVRKPGWYRYAAMVLLMALGLMCKPMLVTLPCALLLLDVWPLGRYGRQPLERLVLEKAPLFILAIASGLITLAAQQQRAVNSSLEATLAIRAANTLVAYMRYIGKMFWPSDLIMFYPFPHSYAPGPGWWAPWIVLAAGLLLVFVTLVAIKLARTRRRRYALVGWLWFVGTLLPMTGLITQQGSQSMADRFTYVPLIGLYILLVWGATDLARRRGRYVPVAAGGVAVIVALIVCTSRQLPHWRDSRALFTHAVQVDPTHWLANHSLAVYHLHRGDKARAFEYLEQMLRTPAFGRHARQRVYDALSMMANDPVGVATLHRAAMQRPNDPRAVLHFAIAMNLNGQTQEALAAVQHAISLDPGRALAYVTLAQVLVSLQQPDAAEKSLRHALLLEPFNPNAHLTLAALLKQQGRTNEARFHIEKVNEYDPTMLGRLKQQP